MISKRREDDIEAIVGYTNLCKELENKDLIKITEDFVDYLINNEIKNYPLAKIISDYIESLSLLHSDSVDAKTIAFYLEDKLKNRGYYIKKIAPFMLKKIS